jgi:glycosyltransferase involved in cell wall biosynthesis
MRILMISHGYPPTISGVTLVVQKLARAMVRAGHTVTVVTASDRYTPYETDDEGVRLIRIRGLRNPFWDEGPLPAAYPGALDAIARELQPNIIHAHEAAALGRQALRLSRRKGVPVIVTCYYVPHFVGRTLSASGQSNYRTDIVEWVAWRYSVPFFNQFPRVVFGTEAHRRFFLKRGLTAPTTVITNGFDASRYCPTNGIPEDLEQRYPLPSRPRILFVSRLMRDKEIAVLIRAMPAVTAARPAHLLLVGRGQDQPRLEQLTAELGMQAFVHFMGFVPEEDLPAFYRASDLFAIASTCEVQSIPTLQAAATGLPVVAADAVALPEAVAHGESGLLVPPGDPQAMAEAILTILDNPDLAARMGQAGIALAAPHCDERMFELYEQLYLEVGGSAGGWESGD